MKTAVILTARKERELDIPYPLLAFDGSIDLAEQLGVPTEELLTSKKEIDSYFLD